MISLILTLALLSPGQTSAAKIVASARDQISWGTVYDPGYFAIGYPNGDLPRTKGVCTDVVVRALRAAGYDLQVLIHRDMTANWSLYPKKWGAKRPDRNIDHRRTPNQIVYFKRFGITLPTKLNSETKKHFQPGDIVFWNLTSSIKHVGILSDRKNREGWPLVIHNLSTTKEEDVLHQWEMIAHFRFPKPR